MIQRGKGEKRNGVFKPQITQIRLRRRLPERGAQSDKMVIWKQNPK